MRVVIIGAGAAGLVAAAEAARRGADVHLLEKNNKLGVKILMSGGTRCNLTHHTDARGITEHFRHARRFLQPSVGAFPPDDVVRMFQDAGVATKVEATGKVFPVSNRAIHARDALVRIANDAGVKTATGQHVTGVHRTGSTWLVQSDGDSIGCDRVVITAGGMSYPGCGTTGDAYQWLAQIGHTIVPPRPALVPLLGGAKWTHGLSGLTLNDCVAEVRKRNQTGKRNVLATRRAPWLFTHFGFSGPAAMDVSHAVTAAPSVDQVSLFIDLLPELTSEEIQKQLMNRSGGQGRQRVSSLLANWLPQRLVTALIELDPNMQPELTLSQLSRSSLRHLIGHIKSLPLDVTGTRGFPKAEVTAGGVQLSEVNPKTMQSRIASGLFIAGEVLDVDGPIGGYNFQAAFSTGRAAGAAAAQPDVE